MWKNYLLIARRTLKRDKLFAVFNIIGLAIRVVAGMLICIYVQDATALLLRDALGRHVLSQRINGTQGSMDMAQLPAGSYIVELSLRDGGVRRAPVLKR